jgi:transposase-like protein
MATYALLDCSVDGQYGGRAPGARSPVAGRAEDFDRSPSSNWRWRRQLRVKATSDTQSSLSSFQQPCEVYVAESGQGRPLVEGDDHEPIALSQMRR